MILIYFILNKAIFLYNYEFNQLIYYYLSFNFPIIIF